MSTDHKYFSEVTVDEEMQKHRWFLYLIFFIHVFLGLFFLKFNSYTAVILPVGLFLIISWIFLSVRNTLAILLLYLSILPIESWGENYHFFKGYYFQEYILFFFVALLGYWIIINRHISPIGRHPSTRYNFIFGFFSILAVLSALHGAFTNANFNVIYSELLYLLLYLFYFIAIDSYTSRHIKTLIYTIICISVIVSFEYILLAFEESEMSSIFISRVVTQQPHLAQIAFPICVGYLIFTGSLKTKLFMLFAAILNLGMIFFSQQRGLWVGIVFSLILLGGFRYLFDDFTVLRLIKYFFLVVFIFLIILGIFYVVDNLFFGSVFLTILSRISTLSSLSTDASTNIRLLEIIRALKLWDNNVFTILFGTGLGSSYMSINIERTYHYSLDNSYAIILWKMGLLGLVVFLLIYIHFIIKGFKIFIKTNDAGKKIIVASILSGIGGLMVIALTNACLVRYRFIIIWAILLGVIEIFYRDLNLKKDDAGQNNLQ
jgi:hypothetical protein